MIQPLILGDKTFSNNLIQGPLAGISCAPFRRLVSRYSKPAFTCTEMLSCKTLLHQPAFAMRRYIQKDPTEGPVCFQLSSNDPTELAEATKRVTDLGADLIDLNCGCPVKKIRIKGAGSRLLADATKVYQLISAMKQNTHLPVAIKIRVDGDTQEKFNKEIVKAVNDVGVDFLIVHGRHWSEHYETPCRYDEIQFFVTEVKAPVIGNGDITSLASLKKMFATGCHGAMISRAGVGQPWLIHQLIAEMNQIAFVKPSQQEIGNILIEHVRELSALLANETFALLQARKFAKYYACDLQNKMAFSAALNECQQLSQFEAICQRYFN